MHAHQVLKKANLVTRHAIDAEVDAILAAVRELDAGAAVLTVPQALASRDLAARLWKALPEEANAYTFDSPAALTAAAPVVLDAPRDEPVILHLGWDVLALRTTLGAAWNAWPHFCDVSIAAYNALIYPESLRWYIVRAGTHLFPMTCDGEAEPAIRSLPLATSRIPPTKL